MNFLKTICVVGAIVLGCNILAAEVDGKAEALQKIRQEYAKKRFRGNPRVKESFETCQKLLLENGQFSDLIDDEKVILDKKMDKSKYSGPQAQVAKLTGAAFDRIWLLAEAFRSGKKDDKELQNRIYRAINHYGKLELGRADEGGRFHESCFAIPTAAINTYFCFFDDMEKVENGVNKDKLAIEANNTIKKVGYQSWTVPKRNDETDKNVVSVDRFRKHVWWVGGNGLTYRPALQCAIMMNSIPMVDVMSKVAKGAVSSVSQNTYEDAFWTEGITSDGAGWGHGMQALVWGYPIHGVSSALWIFDSLNGTPWADKLEKENIDELMNFFRGSSFYFYKGYIPPVIDRMNMVQKIGFPKGNIPNLKLVESIYKNWSDSLTPEQKAELKQFIAEAKSYDVFMENMPKGMYHGSRYFFNNDDMIHKNKDYQIIINMASRRVDGLESAFPVAAGFNLFTADGATNFQRSGDEYNRLMGAMKLTALPGITMRQVSKELKPITNWRGYCSTFNFAGGATSGGDFATGFIYRKLNGVDKDNVNDKTGKKDVNSDIYGVLAYKSYFLFGDTFLALGAAITNEQPDLAGTVYTTLEQSPSINFSQVENNGLAWYINNNFAYAVLPEYTTGKVVLDNSKRRTDWKSLATTANKNAEEYDIDVFQLAIDHGQKIVNGSYAYVVNCDGKATDKLPKILSNSKDLQAAESFDGKSIGGIFFDAKAVLKSSKGNFSVSAPAVLLVEYTSEEEITISVSDATMNKNLKELTVNTPWGEKIVKLPEGQFLGKVVSYNYKL